jgi:hypothetical protein
MSIKKINTSSLFYVDEARSGQRLPATTSMLKCPSTTDMGDVALTLVPPPETMELRRFTAITARWGESPSTRARLAELEIELAAASVEPRGA